ncbi:ABC transporter substrate-binding protein [Dactylosporangium sucinum]|uniref:Peptide ABC transporter substrate-binding protein n=1 Tax=Dactylosporangium sucinum TaxID=1424081 RepID=A0A917T297_9ACTN|nr:ABC transporter substrate-binding protein [Dactylosporangium sucinum]GGM08194.1 peptide ABC transporter substrate-binding protein [Dactylosporangium sucinum]
MKTDISRRSFLGLGAAAGAATLLGACGDGTVPGAAGGGTLKWGWALTTSWDPVTSSAGWDVHVLSLVYAGLTKLDERGDAVPALATGWKYNADGTEVAFTLRPGLKFSDGTPLDATAVKKSLERGRDLPKSLVGPQLVNVAAVEAPDGGTVVIKLKAPDFQIPNLLAGKTGMIVSPKAFESDAAALATQPVGAGPFTLTAYTQNAKAVFARNPDYWDAASIKLQHFEAYPLPEAATVVAALQSGQYDVAQIPGSQVEAAKAAGLQVQVIPSLVVAVLDVNITKKPFDDPKVAEALRYAVDRAALLKTAQFGHGDVAYQPFPKNYVGYAPALDGIYAYNPGKARQLLAESSYQGAPVDVVITTAAAAGVPEQLQSQLQAVGFKPTIEVIPQAQATQLVYVQHAKALFVDQFAGRDSAVQAFQVLFGKEGLMNPGRQQPPELADALAVVSRTPLDSPDYAKVLQEATSVAVRSMPNVFLYSVPRILARRPNVSAIPEFTVVQRFEGVTVA